MKIRIRAILVIVFTNLIIILASIFAGTAYVREHIESYIETDMMVVADIADRFISAEIDLLKFEAAAAAEHLTNAKPEELGAILREQALMYPKFKGMSVMSQNAGILASSGSPASAELIGDEAVRSAFRGASAFTSTVQTNNGVMFYLAVPIPGTPERILVMTLDGMYFADLASEYKVWETGHIFIDDKDGYIIANNRREWVENRHNFLVQGQGDPQYDELTAMLRRLVAGERGIGYYSLSGIPRICAYRPISGSAEGWCLGIVAPLSESPISDVDDGLFLIAVVAVLLNVVAAVIASNFIRRPFEEVAALKEKAEAGLAEQKSMIAEMEQRDHLLQTVNQAIDLLLQSEPESFADTLSECMGMMARSIRADRMYLHKNHTIDGKRYNTKLYEWPQNARSDRACGFASSFLCDDASFLIKDKLSRGESIHSRVEDLPPLCRECLGVQNANLVMIIPIFLRNEFWGFVGFDNCHNDTLLTENEASVMRSGSLLVASAVLRNEYMAGLRDTSSQLEIALVDAKKANSAKSSFLAHMSHEIRTPLNAVIGLSELALGEEGLSRTVEANLEKIYGAGATILSIINDILDITKIESGKLELYSVKYDTPSLINDIMTLNIVRIGEKPIKFKLSIGKNLPGVLYGDDLRIKQIFSNLLSNAFKYTNEGTVEWRISHERDGESVWLVSSISDTGIGMRPEALTKLFSEYNQVDEKTNRKVEGTGLGLAIAKRLAEMMDGAITVESEYGKGSTFSVRLRQTFVDSAPIGRKVAESLMGLSYTQSRRDKTAHLIRVDLSYAHVLVVDDIITNLDVVKGMLKPYKVKVDCATSGRAAIGMIRAENPRYSAVFMDHMMPEMDGIEAVRIIREELGTDYARNVPIIALTANALVGNDEMFLNEGFQDFISKPIDMIKLDAVLRRWVRDKEREGEPEIGLSGGAVNEARADGSPLGGMTIGGIDKHKALERFGGSEEVLIDVLRSYAAHTKPLLISLNEYLASGSLNDYAIVVHGVKGSSYGIFANDVGHLAEKLEHAAKAGDMNAVQASHPAFAVLAEELLDSIGQALQRIDAAANKPTAPAPDPALLNKLREAAAAFDMDRVDAAMERLEACRYERGEELVAWLREKVNGMEFEEIAAEWPDR